MTEAFIVSSRLPVDFDPEAKTSWLSLDPGKEVVPDALTLAPIGFEWLGGEIVVVERQDARRHVRGANLATAGLAAGQGRGTGCLRSILS